jgi:hypothetical protein
LHAARLLCLVGTTLLAVLSLSASAKAGECVGNENALGVSRVVEIDPAGGPRHGTYRYPSTLTLEPKDVMLTFDDGPYPERTRNVLDALDRHCVKATFFEMGRFAKAYPDIVSDLVACGHTSKGGGIVLFHDPTKDTAKAVALSLDALKARDYRVVHIVPKATGVAALSATRPHQAPSRPN